MSFEFFRVRSWIGSVLRENKDGLRNHTNQTKTKYILTIRLILVVVCITVAVEALLSFVSRTRAQADDIFSEWRPNNDTRHVRYVGSKVCIDCHKPFAKQLLTPMAQALERAPDCGVVRARGRLTFRNGPYTYEISLRGEAITYTVADGKDKVTEPIQYCFGEGHVGQTYLFLHNNVLYESRVSYFQKIQTLDFTIGQRQTVPTSLDDAVGRPIGSAEAQQCFGCHSTGAVNGSQLKLDQLSRGIGCEACHGPGEKHIVVAKAKKSDNLAIFNPTHLGALELSQSFCGTCHTGFEQAMLLPGQGGINNIRFQPYRIFNSHGHNTNDMRIGCVACHNPHDHLQKEAVYYDSKCLACHVTSAKEAKTDKRSAGACPVSPKNCVTCHMPKVELPGMHAAFTDHWIRVVKPNEPTPR